MGNTCCSGSNIAEDHRASLGSTKGQSNHTSPNNGLPLISEYTVKEHSKMPDGYPVSNDVQKIIEKLQTEMSKLLPVDNNVKTPHDKTTPKEEKYWEFISKENADRKGIYIGTLDDKKFREGKGKMIWNDGSVYYGDWRSDKTNGVGYLVLHNGDYYIGDWLSDLAHGKGRYHHVDGSEYYGEWKNDKQDGHGMEAWPDGSVYNGLFKDSKKHGQGHFKWADESEYIGCFKDNLIEGEGTYKWADKRKYTGKWEKNHMNGEGEFTWPDGRRYKGNFVNDKKHGQGTFYWDDKNARRFEGTWKDGKQEGFGKYFEKDQEYVGKWENGEVTWENKKPPNNPKNRK